MESKKSPIIKFIILAGIFLLPAFFIVILKQGKPSFFELPYFGEHEIVQKEVGGKIVNDTIHYKVDKFSFTDADNNLLTEKDFENKILIVNFISGKCPNDSLNVCPINFMEFKRYVYDDFVNEEGFEDVRIISHVVNSNDTVADMNLMYKHHEVKGDKWIFVKGMKNAFFDMELGKGNPWLKEDPFYGNDKEAYIITLLLDKERHVRGKYVTALSPDITRISKEIVLLLREEYLKKND
jgi:protein SCO1/2|tara:strand:+ start:139 stop:852 length:714 start_codon:yes stop_codon:yes gene_type:complete